MTFDQNSRDAINTLFGRLRKSPFVEGTSSDPLPQSRPAGDGNIQPVGYIADGAIDDIATFAQTIRPPVVVDTLPSLPDATFPQGAFVFLTTDEKLYRNTDGSTWSVAVDGADVVADSITAGQIAAGAIGASEIAAGAVVASKIGTGAIRVGAMAAPVPGGNLIANPSFEIVRDDYDLGSISGIGSPISSATVAEDVPGWTDCDIPGSGGQVSVSSSTAGHGQNRLGMTGGTPIGTGRLFSNYIPVVPGQTYRCSMLIRGTGGNTGTANLAYWVRWYQKDKSASSTIETNGIANYNVGSSGAWVRREGSVVAPSDAAFARVTAVLSSSSTAGQFGAFDDMHFSAGVHSTNETGEVVIDSTGIAVTNGKITVTNASSTVIIDGTSNMFKILATGTQTAVASANSEDLENVTLTALGTLSSTPQHLSGIGTSNTSKAERYAAYQVVGATAAFAAGSSGGSPTQRFRAILSDAAVFTWLNVSSQCVVTLALENKGTSSATVYDRYYVLKEAAI